MSLLFPDFNSPKKQRNKPSKEDAAQALEHIKTKESEESAEKKRAEQLEIERQKALAEAERIQKEEIERKIKKKLQANLKKKEDEQNKKKLIEFLETGQKIKWKAINSGKKFEGYLEDKFIFEIRKGLTVFSLYIKGKDVIDKNKKTMQGLHGTSVSLHTLKEKAEKILLKLG